MSESNNEVQREEEAGPNYTDASLSQSEGMTEVDITGDDDDAELAQDVEVMLTVCRHRSFASR